MQRAENLRDVINSVTALHAKVSERVSVLVVDRLVSFVHRMRQRVNTFLRFIFELSVVSNEGRAQNLAPIRKVVIMRVILRVDELHPVQVLDDVKTFDHELFGLTL